MEEIAELIRKAATGFHVELTYSKTTDWILYIFRQGCAKDGTDEEVCYVQDPDLNYVISKGQVLLKD